MAQEFSNGYALLIGVGADLSMTVKDVKALYQVLTDPQRAGYPLGQVRQVLEKDATRQGILDGLNWLKAQVKNNPEATAIVYYSGHGQEIRSNSGEVKGYTLIPQGYDSQNRITTGVSGAEFTEKIAELQVQKLLVLLDCCHAGGITKGEEVVLDYPLPRDLDALNLGEGRAVIASSLENEVSKADFENSYFTRALLEAMDGEGGKTREGFVRFFQLMNYISERVPELSGKKQNPNLSRGSGVTNFPICYAKGGVSKGPVGILPKPINEWREKVLTIRLRSAQNEYEERLIKIEYLNKDRVRATSADYKFQLDQQLVEQMKEIKRLEDEISDYQAELRL